MNTPFLPLDAVMQDLDHLKRKYSLPLACAFTATPPLTLRQRHTSSFGEGSFDDCIPVANAEDRLAWARAMHRLGSLSWPQLCDIVRWWLQHAASASSNDDMADIDWCDCPRGFLPVGSGAAGTHRDRDSTAQFWVFCTGYVENMDLDIERRSNALLVGLSRLKEEEDQEDTRMMFTRDGDRRVYTLEPRRDASETARIRCVLQALRRNECSTLGISVFEGPHCSKAHKVIGSRGPAQFCGSMFSAFEMVRTLMWDPCVGWFGYSEYDCESG